MGNIALSFIFILSTLSCVSTTTIKALDNKGEVDKNVKIYVDQKYIGEGMARYSDQKTVYSSVPFLEFKKSGCKNQREKLDIQTSWVTAIIGSLVAGAGMGIIATVDDRGLLYALYGFPITIAGLIPLFWTRKYVPIQEQEFQCIKIVEENKARPIN